MQQNATNIRTALIDCKALLQAYVEGKRNATTRQQAASCIRDAAAALYPPKFADLSEDDQRRAIDDKARDLVNREVMQNASHLVHKLLRLSSDGSAHDLLSEEEMQGLSRREPDLGDWVDARPSGYVVQECLNSGGSTDWRFYPEGEEPAEGESDWFDDALECYEALFEYDNTDPPEGCEALEHWIVSDYAAQLLRQRGESVVDCEALNLTVWARCTSGQAIYADGVWQEIARFMLAGDS